MHSENRQCNWTCFMAMRTLKIIVFHTPHLMWNLSLYLLNKQFNHRLVTTLISPLCMHTWLDQEDFVGLKWWRRLIMNDEWWNKVNDQLCKQLSTTYKCNTTNGNSSHNNSILACYMSLFFSIFFTSTLCFLSFLFALCLWHTLALCAFTLLFFLAFGRLSFLSLFRLSASFFFTM